MYCNNCGNELNNKDNFCSSCGKKIIKKKINKNTKPILCWTVFALVSITISIILIIIQYLKYYVNPHIINLISIIFGNISFTFSILGIPSKIYKWVSKLAFFLSFIINLLFISNLISNF